MVRIAFLSVIAFGFESAICLAANDDFIASVTPILTRHCMQCHSGDEPKSDFDLSLLSPDFSENTASWNAVLDRLADGSMPPKDRPRLSAESRTTVTNWIAAGLSASQKQKMETEGRARLRRLNRIEYVNTIRELLGAEIDVEQLPEDGVAAGFDNVDTALDLSSALLESYLITIDTALDAVFVKGPSPERTQQHIDLVSLAKMMTKTNRPMPRFGISTRIHDDHIIFYSQAMASKPINEAQARKPGLYRFRFVANSVNVGRPMALLVYVGNYGMGVQGLFTRLVGMYDVNDTPTEIEFTIPLAMRETIRMVPYSIPNVYTEVPDDFSGPGLAMAAIEVDGPIIDTWPPAPTVRLLGNLEMERATIVDAENILRRFAKRAFRRPVDESELVPFFALVKSRMDNGYTFEAALRVGLKGILCSPNFLYLCATPGKLNDYDLASRLSYFLWSSAPDNALMKLADHGELGRPEVLKSEVERMLADSRSRAFTENFTGQWLSLRNLKATIPDKKLYPNFDEWLEYSMPQETYAFFEEILGRNHSVLEFIHSDWSILNERLAAHYDISDVQGSAFRIVKLPPDKHRGGVMTQASVLKVTANGTNTSPVVRGAWVLDHLLGTPAPPPPKDVPAIEPDIRGAKTIREQLTKHRQAESCAACHAMIDPPGNALENFDVIGGWREYYRVVPGEGRQQIKFVTYDGRKKGVGRGPDVDAADELSGGKKFSDVDSFKQLLLAEPDRFARGLTEKLLVYATGHRLEFSDREPVSAIVDEIKQNNYGLRTLIHAVVQSPTFRSK